jgi:NADPH:quinone reductase-like Zn-dependent oxidoreductase
VKAIMRETYGPPEELRFGDVAEPVIGDDDVLVRVVAAGVDQGVWHLVTG